MAKEKPGNQTAGTPDLSETELRAMHMDDLRERARREGVEGASSLRKEELVKAISELHREGRAHGSPGAGGSRSSGRTEAELHEMRLDDLHRLARDEGVKGASSMKKSELVDALTHTGPGERNGRNRGEATADDLAADETGAPGDRGPDGGRKRTGPQTSKSLKYAQEVTSLDDDPERAGRSLVTTSHEVIRTWAESRDGVPATVEGTEHGDRAGVLRFDFGERTDKLRHITWEEWFRTFDERHLNFVYQEERKDGRQSTFFILENPDREDA
jgi:hypothetical protein